MSDIERDEIACMYECPTCQGTGSLESSDSTDDRWWDCSRCEGTGKLAERRHPDERFAKAVSDAELGRALVDRMFELPRGPEWEQALAELRVWSMKDHSAPPAS